MNRSRLIRSTTTLAVAAATAILAASSASSADPASSLPTLTLALKAGKPVIVGGSETSGAVNIVTTVTGEPLGWATLFRLKPGVTPTEFFKIAHRNIDAIGPYGSIVFDAATPAGKSSAQTQLQPGTYIADDLYGSGNPSAEFTISRSTTPATLPKPGARITATNRSIHSPRSLHAGELVRFENDGTFVHDIFWVRTKNVPAAKQADTLLLAGKARQARKYATGQGTFAGLLSTRGEQQLTVNEKPGIYILYSQMRTHGRPDYQLGLLRTLRITK